MRHPERLIEAAGEIGRDQVLGPDPTGDNIIIAAVELVYGDWPLGFSVDRYFADQIVDAYFNGFEQVTGDGKTMDL